jgi:GxxExxY protein
VDLHRPALEGCGVGVTSKNIEGIHTRHQMPRSREGKFSEASYPHQDLTHEIIAACYAVYQALGFGFLEKVYLRALVVELGRRGLSCRREVPFIIEYEGVEVGMYRADLVVVSLVVVEVKTGLLLDPAAVSQTLNYVRASGVPIGLVCYFGPNMKVRRVANTMHRSA